MSEQEPTLPPAVLPHDSEYHEAGMSSRLNWLRAGVLGANDGVTSVAGIVVGVAGATHDRSQLLVAGIAGLVAGALSMAAGEYVSVSTQRDSEKAQLHKERTELDELPDHELEELTQIYEGKGLNRGLAEQVAEQLTAHDALRAHAEAELGIDPDDLTSPIQAAMASMAAFTVGALIPVIAILNPNDSLRVPLTFALVIVMLAITGFISARLGGAPTGRAVARNVAGGAIAMLITYGIGHVVGRSV